MPGEVKMYGGKSFLGWRIMLLMRARNEKNKIIKQKMKDGGNMLQRPLANLRKIHKLLV